MPMLIETIDAIARAKQRDVLLIVFNALRFGSPDDRLAALHYDYRQDPMRRQVIDWLDAHRIPWQPCGDLPDESAIPAYEGQIYLDIPFDESDPVYQAVSGYLEHPDGSLRWPTVIFQYFRLEEALRYAQHDEPDNRDAGP
ncbi:MAG: hypothetical protein ACKN9W_01055 [Methylococcus sp.]